MNSINNMNIAELRNYIVNNLVDQSYNKELKTSIEKTPINRMSKEELDELQENANSLLNEFQSSHKRAFILHLENTQYANELLNICSIYMNILYNSFLNPINYELNKKAMKLAKISLWISVGIAILSFALTIYYGKC